MQVLVSRNYVIKSMVVSAETAKVVRDFAHDA